MLICCSRNSYYY